MLFTLRKTDVLLDLVERANIANRANANILCRFTATQIKKNTAASGTETYVMGMAKLFLICEAGKKGNSVITSFRERL
jgi:N-acetylmuramoyl-L-alanine amidase